MTWPSPSQSRQSCEDLNIRGISNAMRIVLSLFVGLFTFLSGLAVWAGARDLITILWVEEWRPVSAQITSVGEPFSRRRIGYQVVVRFEYSVDGKMYQGEHALPSEPPYTKWYEERRHRSGEPILVYYNPDRPHVHYQVDHPRSRIPSAIFTIVLGSMFCLILGGILLFIGVGSGMEKVEKGADLYS